jgi:DNA-binding MarR family transcriptional regulator
MDQNHPFAEQLRSVLETQIANQTSIDKLTDDILQTLDRNKLLYYADPGRLNLLNAHGRVLIAVLEDPGITQRALSIYLGVSESNINKSLRLLVKDGLIEKRRDGIRNRYQFNAKRGLQHPDIARFARTIIPLVGLQAMPQTQHHQLESPKPDTNQDQADPPA